MINWPSLVFGGSKPAPAYNSYSPAERHAKGATDLTKSLNGRADLCPGQPDLSKIWYGRNTRFLHPRLDGFLQPGFTLMKTTYSEANMISIPANQTFGDKIAGIVDSRWKGLYIAGGLAAFAMLLLIIIQIIVLVIWPPPATIEGYFSLFQKSWLLGLLSLDLIYIVDSVIQILIYLGVYFVLRKTAESSMLVALIFGIVGIAAYFASNTAFEMFSLSNQFAAASTEAQRTMFLAAGQVMLETYKGTAFDIYYVLNAIVLFIFSGVMLRSKLFSRAAAYLGFLAGILMIVPSSAGTLGLYFALASLIPWAAWLVLVGQRLLRFGRSLNS
jgi:hypothetical protein